MGLKRKIESLDGLDDAVASLYREDAAGGYVLDLDGDAPGDDVGALKRALEHERKQRQEAVRRAKELEARIAPDPAPQPEPAPQPTDFDGKLKAATKPLLEQIEALKRSHEDALKRAKEAEVARKRADVFGRARQVASQQVREDLLDDFLAARVERLFEFDDEAGDFVPKRNGELIYDPENPGRPAAIETVIGQILADKSAAPYRRQSRGMDLGEPGAGVNGASIVLSAADARDPQKYQRARELAAKQGKEVAIQ